MAEQKMNEQKTAEEKMTGQKPAEQKIPEENMAGQKPAEQKIREEKTAEQKAASESLSDENLSEEDISEDKDPEENDAGEAPRTIDKSILRKANRYFFSKVIVNIILIILGAVLISMFLRRLQENTAIVKQQENCVLALGEAVSMLEENAENAKTLSQIYHDSNQDVLDDMHRLFLSGLFDSLADAGRSGPGYHRTFGRGLHVCADNGRKDRRGSGSRRRTIIRPWKQREKQYSGHFSGSRCISVYSIPWSAGQVGTAALNRLNIPEYLKNPGKSHPIIW